MMTRQVTTDAPAGSHHSPLKHQPSSHSSVNGASRRAAKASPPNPVTSPVLKYNAAILNAAYDALIGMTLEGVVCSWNQGATRLFGYTPAEALGHPVSFLGDPSQSEEQQDLLREARAGSLSAPIETTRRRRDGTAVPVELNVIPIRNYAGRVVALATVARDISERKKAEAHRALMAQELQHRVKNTLATVQAIARLSLHGTTSLEAFGAIFTARLQSLSTTHDLLTRNGGQRAKMSEIIQAELAPYRGAAMPRWSTSGIDFTLDPEHAVAFGMLFHELATNAVKYGAFSLPGGAVQIEWQKTQDGGPRLKLVWSENNGPPVHEPTRQGFGTRLVTGGLARELNGVVNLTFLPAGLRCAIDIPYPASRNP